MEVYLAAHQDAIVSAQDLLNQEEEVDVATKEAKLAASILQMHEVTSKILRDNHIIPE